MTVQLTIYLFIYNIIILSDYILTEGYPTLSIFILSRGSSGYRKTNDKAEIEGILKGFPKDKSLGPNGWTIRFFLFFYYLVVDDLLDVVEQSRIEGFFLKALNATFLTLIYKGDKHVTFAKF